MQISSCLYGDLWLKPLAMQLAKVPLPDLLAEVAHRSVASAPAGLDGDDFFGPPLLLRLAAGKSAGLQISGLKFQESSNFRTH